jgi:microcystin degradation protein MlrC
MLGTRMRILLASCLHESNSFNRFPAGLAHFERLGILRGEAVPERFANTRTEMGGFLAAAQANGWAIETPLAVPPASAGIVDREAFETFKSILHDGARAMRPDGVLLALHGAMVAEHDDDPDGALAQAVREAVGADAPIVLTLDPHGNVSDRLAAAVNGISAYRTHPHTDHFETGQRAAAMLARALAASELPQVHLARRPQLRGFDSCRTEAGHGPMQEALALARGLEAQEPGIYEVSIHSGFGLADSWHTGPTAAVTAARRAQTFQAAAERMMDFAWANRARETFRLLAVEEALAAARAAPPGPGPIVLSDFGDAPGGGAYGDATAMLSALLRSGLPGIVFAGLLDPAAAAAAHQAGIGARLTLDLGGHTDAGFGGGPVRVEASVEALSDGDYVNDGPYATGSFGRLGPSALLRTGNCRIFVNSIARNVLDRAQLRLVGLTPEACGVLSIKGMDATRAAFQPGSRAYIAFESGGIASRRGGQLPYRRLRRPIWPLDDVGG